MKVVYEVGDVLKTESGHYLMIVVTGFEFGEQQYGVINLEDGIPYDSDFNNLDENGISEFVTNEKLEYVGKAKDVIYVKEK